MRHLYSSRVEVLRLSATMVSGTPTLAWTKITAVPDPVLGTAGELLCRLDLGFMRLGRDQPMAVVAGRAPDRVGVMFFDATAHVKAGDRVHTLAGPITGTFEIRPIPDPATDMTRVHHMEVQVVEVAQALDGVFPAAAPVS